MKYLDKTFSISMATPKGGSFWRKANTVSRQKKGLHDFELYSAGMCFHCTLDQIGHDALQERLRHGKTKKAC